MGGTNINVFDPISRQLPSTIVGNPTTGIRPFIHRVVDFDGTDDTLEYQGFPTDSVSRKVAFAAVLVHDAASDDVVLSTSTANLGYRMQIVAGGTELSFVKGGVVVIGSGINLTSGDPYFIVESYDTGSDDLRFLAKNLRTGLVLTATTNNTATPLNGDGIYTVGGISAFSAFVLDGAIAMAAIGQGFLTLGEMRTWAHDPYQIFSRVLDEAGVVYASAPPAGVTVPVFERYYRSMRA